MTTTSPISQTDGAVTPRDRPPVPISGRSALVEDHDRPSGTRQIALASNGRIAVPVVPTGTIATASYPALGDTRCAGYWARVLGHARLPDQWAWSL